MIDAENLELYLLGDINCDLLAESPKIALRNSSAFLPFTTFLK